MEKPRIKKRKSIQMKYPAPYSQSWASPESQEKTEKPKKKPKKNFPTLQQISCPGCYNRPKAKGFRGVDPYAPHLKYGIFPYAQKARNAVTSVSTNLKDSRNTTDPTITSELPDNKGENKKIKKGPSDTPFFVIRPIDKRKRRQLSLSETLHLDIKPRKNVPKSPVKYLPVHQLANYKSKMNAIE